MVPVLTRAAYEAAALLMRSLAPTRFREDFRRDAMPPHVTASITATVPANHAETELVPWLRMGLTPCSSLILTSDPQYGLTVYFLVRGELDDSARTRP